MTHPTVEDLDGHVVRSQIPTLEVVGDQILSVRILPTNNAMRSKAADKRGGFQGRIHRGTSATGMLCRDANGERTGPHSPLMLTFGPARSFLHPAAHFLHMQPKRWTELLETHFTHNPALIVAIALAVGVIAQTIARHVRLPGIVLLLGAGLVLGPDVLGVLEPADLGAALEVLVGFSVAVILFDGGLNLNFKRMRSQAPAIQRLLSLGVVVTAGGGALAARLCLGWPWLPCILFGTLVIVTGPTVVTPLLRRIKVRKNLETILETEGVLIDAVGAVVAVVALEIAVGDSVAAEALGGPARLLIGAAVGLGGGLLLAVALRVHRLIPEGFETIFTLSLALATYQLSNALMEESGIMAAIVAGAVVGNAGARSFREIREFKEQLTVMLIGMLFVLLAADVRVADVIALGRPGLLVVLALIFVVRPLNVLACTAGTGLNWREKAFLSWVAPRGIVAAAVASLFAERLAHHGQDVGTQLRALVFLVIAATVVVQGATAGTMARLLKVRRPSQQGFRHAGGQPSGAPAGPAAHGSRPRGGAHRFRRQPVPGGRAAGGSRWCTAMPWTRACCCARRWTPGGRP